MSTTDGHLPKQRSSEPEQYSMNLYSQSFAGSPSDALGMFLVQMSTGNVGVTIHNVETEETWELDDLDDENAEDQLNLALHILWHQSKGMSNHEKIALVAQVDKALGLNRKPAT